MSKSRREFLRLIHFYRDLNWSIYFTDETWCSANHTLQRGWVECISEKSSSNFDMYRAGVQKIGNYRGGFVTPSGAGKRVIILHIGNENDFVDTCMISVSLENIGLSRRNECKAFRRMVSSRSNSVTNKFSNCT